MNELLLEVKSLGKSFHGEALLKNVCLSVYSGETIGLIGANGAGKSLLIKHLAGVLTPDEGSLWFSGREVRFNSARDAQDAGITTLYQQVNLIGSLSIAENIMINRLPTLAGYVLWRRLYNAADAFMEKLGFPINTRLPVSSLSSPHKRRVELGKAIFRNTRLLILDEPYLGFSEPEAEAFGRCLTSLQAQGVGIILVSHCMPEILRLCQTAVIMNNGRLSEKLPVNSLSPERLAAVMRRPVRRISPKLPLELGRVLLETRAISAGGFRELSFSLHKREILGITGDLNSGKMDIGPALFGWEELSSGELYLNGTPLDLRSPKDAITAGIGYLPEDTNALDLYANFDISQNITISRLSEIFGCAFYDKKQENELSQQLVDELYIRAERLQTPIDELSGGNQQKVRLARWLFAGCKVLILEEPTASIDVCSKTDVYNFICNYVINGCAVLLISSNTDELFALCDRIIQLENGSFKAEYARQNFSSILS